MASGGTFTICTRWVISDSTAFSGMPQNTGLSRDRISTVEIRTQILLQLSNEARRALRSEEHTSELQSRENLVCRLLLEKKKQRQEMDKLFHRKTYNQSR